MAGEGNWVQSAEGNGKLGVHEAETHKFNTSALDDLRFSNPAPRLDSSEQHPEYKNGLASEKLVAIEKWFDTEASCGKVNQDQLADKLSSFAKDTNQKWDDLEKTGKVENFLDMSQDQFMTYPRFVDLLMSLDDEHREQVRKESLGRLTPGE